MSIETVLEKISCFDIFKFYMSDKTWRLNQATNSPFRKDTNPSFVIGNTNGHLYFIDYGDTQYRGGCFDFVQMLFNISSLNEVLIKIDKDFGLGISFYNENVGEYKRIIAEYKQPEELGKRYCLIQVKTRRFTQAELEYWSQYYQSEEDLKANNIYSIKELYMNRKRFPLKDDELRFGYLYEGGHWKIYQPLSEKKKKWMSNVPLITAYGLSNLSKDKNTLICKSMKDYLVCRKVYENVCHIQNESLAAFSDETLSYIRGHSREVFYGGDSDEPGKKASYSITETFGFKHINPPDYLLKDGCKDFACWGKQEGIDKLKEHFIKKGLIKTQKSMLYW